MKDKPYPRKCPNCREQTLFPLVEDTTAELLHDGLLYTVTVPKLDVQVCTSCNVRNWPYEASERVTDALRVAAGILTPAEILAARLRLGVAPEELAAQFEVPEAEYSRWESGGQLQSRANDKLLRLYFADPARFRGDVAWPNVATNSPEVATAISGPEARYLDL